jgi:serine phosphatase RsbU (regulator of sigma subunit)
VELQVAVAKVSKYAVRESGDTLEMIERPHGGMSFTLVDGMYTGRGAKAISNQVARKVISLLAEGVRDGAAARAAHDYLYTQNDGKVSAELHIVSIDLLSKTIVISRNSHCPVVVGEERDIRLLNEPSEAIGFHRRMKPVITELPLELHTTVVVFTDGVMDAGLRYGQSFDVAAFVKGQLDEEDIGAQKLANAILEQAKQLDRGRPNDDTSVLVLRVLPQANEDATRRMALRFPIE